MNNQNDGDLPEIHLDEPPVDINVGTTGPQYDTVPTPVVEEQSAPESDIEPSAFSDYGPSSTVEASGPCFAPLREQYNDNTTLVIPSDSLARIYRAMDKLPNIDLRMSPGVDTWLDTVRAGMRESPYKDTFYDTQYRPGSAWRQEVKSERGPLSAARPKWRELDEGTKLVGERAILRIRAIAGIGGLIQVPLWHSGFWVTLKTPTEAAMLELERRILEEKILLGRRTGGAVFSNYSVYQAHHIVQLILDHVYDSTLQNRADILNKIQVHDLHHLVWGLANAIWPNGFPYSRAIFTPGEEGERTVREHLNLGKLQWTDTTALTPWQVSHMSMRNPASHSDADIARYQKEFAHRGRRVELAPKIAVMLRVPTLSDYLDAGQRWVDSLVKLVDDAFGLEQDPEARNKHILDNASATNIRQHCHFVEQILLENSVIDDSVTMESALDEIGTVRGVREAYEAGIQKFIEDTTISLIATPTVDRSEEGKFDRYPHLLPLDTMSTFFTLLGQRLRQIKARD